MKTHPRDMMEIQAVLVTVFILNMLIGLVMVNTLVLTVGLVAGVGLLLSQVWR